jgi:signal transduction histidine kinase
MRKFALVFVLVVFVPSLVLAWLAVRSVRDQQFLLEKQRSLLYQGVTDALAKQVQEALAERQRLFSQEVSLLLHDREPRVLAHSFNSLLRRDWPLAQVGFVVTPEGELLSPSDEAGPEARAFRSDNAAFLSNRETAEVYLNQRTAQNNLAYGDTSSWPPRALSRSLSTTTRASDSSVSHSASADNNSTLSRQEFRKVVPQQNAEFAQNNLAFNGAVPASPLSSPASTDKSMDPDLFGEQTAANLKLSARSLEKAKEVQAENRSDGFQPPAAPAAAATQPISKVAASATEFRQLIGEGNEGTVARFVNNRLNVLVWCRPATDSPLIFGAQISLPRLLIELRPLVEHLDPQLQTEICLALLDDTAKPVILSHTNYQGIWKRPFVATEIGEALPHWEVAAYLLDPGKLTQAARTLNLTLTVLIAALVLAIGIGSWLIVSDLNRQLTLARQKTDFVSNVSHELKTPLTSIRMFSELLAEGRVHDPARQKSYLEIISSEASRLTRLINNVLDFGRMERGEKKYQFQPCDLVAVVRETVDAYRPHLEADGFRLECTLAQEPVPVHGDRDALAQILVNLLSNAEKYSGQKKEITVQLLCRAAPLPYAEVRVLDRGLGVPKGSEERIFEQFYRAHDALNSGIQGSGLGLTLARQIARAHGGEVAYEPRDGGGSCFSLRLPLTAEKSL